MESTKKLKIVLTGGGTGGHIVPLIAVYRELFKLTQNNKIKLKCVFIGPIRNNKGLFKTDNIKTLPLFTGRLRRYITFKSILLNFIDIFKLIVGFLQAIIYLIIFHPDIIFSKGGYGSFPTTIAAWFFKIPIIIHESDSIPGTTNRFLAKFAKKVVVSFPGEYKQLPNKKIIQLGTPLRNMLNINKEKAKNFFDLQNVKPILFITGASQGAEQINELVLANLENLTQKYEIIHQVGDKNYKKISQRIKEFPTSVISRYHIFPYLPEEKMIAAYVVADIVISRASSTNLFEIALLAKPSILIPLPTSAAGHQLKNAQIYSQQRACLNLDPFTITPKIFLDSIDNLMSDAEKLKKMSQAAKNFS